MFLSIGSDKKTLFFSQKKEKEEFFQEAFFFHQWSFIIHCSVKTIV
jgi:hypothetical protein